MTHWPAIAAAVSAATGRSFSALTRHAVGGGCINQTYVIADRDQRYFVKLTESAVREMFAAEAEGLQALAASGAIRVPAPICWATHGETAYLVLEYLPLGSGESDSADRLGAQLAALHRHTALRFGWHRDNTIGATPQINTPCDDWPEFWRERRLGYQLQLAAQRGCGTALRTKGERLLDGVASLLTNHAPAAALLHGDLWSGNYAMLATGQPVIFDPAVYYGDRETDLAMTELFGGFSPRFYAAYRDHYPLSDGYALRRQLYNLYHVLNHFNLFGGGYAAQAERVIDRLLSEIH